MPRHSTPQPLSAHPTHLPQPLQLPPRTGETLDYEFPLARSRIPVPRARMGRDGRARRWPGKVSSWIMSSPPGTKRSCQAGFGEPSAVMMTDSSRSSPAKPHPRAGTPRRLPEVSRGVGTEQTPQGLVGSWSWAGPMPSPPAALTPRRAQALCPTMTIPTKAPDSTGLSFQGEKKSCGSPTYTHVTPENTSDDHKHSLCPPSQ